MKFEVDKLEEYKEQILNSKKDKKVVKRFYCDSCTIIIPSYDMIEFDGGIRLFYSEKFGWNLFKRGKNIVRSKDWENFKWVVVGYFLFEGGN